jgi:hypothetical protein
LDDVLSNLTDFKPQIGENIFYIYVLTESNTKIIRYVGITVNPTKRYNGHLNDINLHENNHKSNWLKKLHTEKKTPDMYILHKLFCVVEEADKVETYYIQLLSKHFKLTNFQKNKNDGIFYIQRLKNIGAKNVFVFDKNGKFVEKIETTNQACVKYKICFSEMYVKIHNKSLFNGQFYFSRSENDDFSERKAVYLKTKCYEFDVNGTIIKTFDSYSEAEKYHGFKRRTVHRSVKKKHFCKGKIFSSDVNFDVNTLKKKSKITKI